MKTTKAENAKSVNEKSVKNTQVQNNGSAQKPRALKNLANDESKLEMFGKAAAVRAVKTAFDNKESKTRDFVLSLGFTANSFKQLSPDDLDVKSKSGTRFCTWEVLNALKKYSIDHDLTGEQAKKAAAKEERAKLAAARERIRQQKIVVAREKVGESWCKCTNIFGDLVGYQLLDVNGAPVGKVWSESEYKTKKATAKK